MPARREYLVASNTGKLLIAVRISSCLQSIVATRRVIILHAFLTGLSRRNRGSGSEWVCHCSWLINWLSAFQNGLELHSWIVQARDGKKRL